MTPEVGFALASALHAGFQLTVTAIVYPALVEVGAPRWGAAHDAHSRRIAPVVAVVYAALLGAGAWLVASGPTALGWVGLAGAAGAMGVTAALAAPLHGRLGGGEQPLRRRLITVDRVRAAFALVGALAAVLALVVT